MKYLQFFAAMVAGLCLTTSAQAYLGSFAPSDGYHVQSGLVYGDVSYYDAGQYGANAGGGSGPNQIVADSGLWSVQKTVGGYFSNIGDRVNYISGTPPYPNTGTGALAAYVVGNHGPGRTDNSSLAIRNDTPLGVTGPLVYDSKLDTFDFGGVAPVSVTSGPLQVGLYFCPNPGDSVPDPSGSIADKFTMSLLDSTGNIGLQWGYSRDNTVTWRDSPSNSWNVTSIVADQTNWDGVRFDLDLTADTFAMDYFDVSASIWTNIVPTGTAMGQAMGNFTEIRWQLEDGLNAGVGGKNFFDDFSFTVVPEPSSLMLLAGALSSLIPLRKRRR
ncbi:PEP-CTERM sorting domain-containing protein [Adhaeretor mobilis]|uniref:PEP-CTERM protein-sorting domain-containing protein n=1 Tax=Adhaeretor mobilis TaxID=1930276 RepID=A0A517MZK2_9BACT|nr:PEP-CTERM sorting domain-containing protein [Adhaeretor mobilis]QDT00228.1 hypothetical protein HG15A2_35640 [Adhaeretor mobilis]